MGDGGNAKNIGLGMKEGERSWTQIEKEEGTRVQGRPLREGKEGPDPLG